MVSRLEGRMVLNTKITSGDTRKPLRQHIENGTMPFVQKNVHEQSKLGQYWWENLIEQELRRPLSGAKYGRYGIRQGYNGISSEVVASDPCSTFSI